MGAWRFTSRIAISFAVEGDGMRRNSHLELGRRDSSTICVICHRGEHRGTPRRKRRMEGGRRRWTSLRNLMAPAQNGGEQEKKANALKQSNGKGIFSS